MNEVVEYLPDYSWQCEVCGAGHVVTCVNKRGKTVYKGDMCGVCTWGESKMIDPEEWNK